MRRLGAGLIQDEGPHLGLGPIRDVYRKTGQGCIQEDRSGTYTGRPVRDLYRKTGQGPIQEDRCGIYTGMDKLVFKRSRRGSRATRQLTDEWS